MLYKLLDPRIDDIDYVYSLRAKAQALLLEGKTLMEWSGEGSSGKKVFPVSVEVVLEETKWFIRDYLQKYPVTQVKPLHL
jgi:hypothetical protein